MDAARPRSEYGARPALSLDYLSPHSSGNNAYLSAGGGQFYESPTPVPNTWDTHPGPALPRIPTNDPAPAPSPAHLFNTFARYPSSNGSRRVPAMFKIPVLLKTRPKQKQVMACLFCRARKIGCVRPPDDEPDQTCK